MQFLHDVRVYLFRIKKKKEVRVYDILWVRILPEEQKVMRALCFFKRHAVRDDKAAESRRECLIIKISCTVRYFKHLLKTA
jgi:hypothetical protein